MRSTAPNVYRLAPGRKAKRRFGDNSLVILSKGSAVEVPGTLFKYLSPDRVNILASRLIRFTSPAEFNDPFDSLPAMGITVTEDETRRIITESMDESLSIAYGMLQPEARAAMPPDMFRTLMGPKLEAAILEQSGFIAGITNSAAKRSVQEGVRGMLGVLSLSEVPDDLLMWAHYAGNHEGFVLAFDTSSPFFDRRKGPDDDLRHLRPVEYGPERPDFSDPAARDFRSFLAKSDHWAYEREWRMAMLLDSADETVGTLHLFRFPPEALTAVIVGCRASEDTVSAISVAANAMDIPVFRAEADDRRFRLNVPGFAHGTA